MTNQPQPAFPRIRRPGRRRSAPRRWTAGSTVARSLPWWGLLIGVALWALADYLDRATAGAWLPALLPFVPLTTWTADTEMTMLNSGGTISSGSIVPDYPADLLLHLNTATWADAAGRHTVAERGTVSLDTSDKQFGAGSAYSNATGCLNVTGNLDDFKFGSGDFYIEFWVSGETSPADNRDLLYLVGSSDTFSNAAGPEFLLRHRGTGFANSRELQWAHNSAGSAVVYTSGAAVDLSGWHRVSVQNDTTADTFIISLDGVAQISQSAISITPRNVTNLYIGGGNLTSDLYLLGNIDEVRIIKGVADPGWATDRETGMYAEALIHDAGAFVMDAGDSDHAFNNSTLATATTGSPTLAFWYDDTDADPGAGSAAAADSGATYEVTAASAATVQGTADTARQFRTMKVRVTATAVGDSLDAITFDTYSTDVTPPAAPTLARVSGPFGETGNLDNYALIWTEPDSGFDHAELRRDIGGVSYYLDDDGAGGWTWTATSTDPLALADDGTEDVPLSGWVDEDVTGTPTYYVRSVDAAGNASAWQVFTAASTSDETPDTLTVSAAAGDGQVTLTVTAGSASDEVYVYYRATSASALTALGGSPDRTGSGTVTVSGLSNGTTYEFICVARAAGCYSLPSAPVFATPTASSLSASGWLSGPMSALRNGLAASATWQTWCGAESAAEAKLSIHYGGYEATTKAAYEAARPAIILGVDEGITQRLVGGGTRQFTLPAGALAVLIEANVAAAYNDDRAYLEESYLNFCNLAGAVLQELIESSGTAGNLNVSGVDLAVPPQRPRDEYIATEGDYWQAIFAVSWGEG